MLEEKSSVFSFLDLRVAESRSSVLARLRNPGRRRNRASAPREPHSCGVKNAAATLSTQTFLRFVVV